MVSVPHSMGLLGICSKWEYERHMEQNIICIMIFCWSSVFIRRIIYKFLNVCPFDYTAFAVSGKVGIPLSGLTTPVGFLPLPNWPSLVGPQSLCNRRFWWRFNVVTLLFFFLWVKGLLSYDWVRSLSFSQKSRCKKSNKKIIPQSSIRNRNIEFQ